MSDLSRKQAQTTLYLQSGIALMLAFMCGIFISLPAGYSALLGGVATVIPAFIFMRFAFAHHGARAAQQIVNDFYIGQFLKFISMAILFAAILIFVRIHAIAFMMSFVVTQLVTFFAPWFFSLRRAEVA